MKNSKIKVQPLSIEEMLNHKSSEYNPTEWVKSVKRYMDLGANFYESKPDEIYDYTRFFITYKIDGLYFFSKFSDYSGSLTNNGFVRAFIIGGEVFTRGFGPDCDKRINNSKEGRKWLSQNVCAQGVMITNEC